MIYDMPHSESFNFKHFTVLLELANSYFTHIAYTLKI